mmetsp:Transcript_53080/g.140015  ORF Transcript_53080/g.140015 Transcript_53080/m.140015 type:complete len:182 (-) Transcript_53080:286-831(-)
MQLPTRDSVDRDFVISLRDKDSDCGNKGTLFLAARCRRDFDVWVRAFGALASRQPQQVSETDVITDDVQKHIATELQEAISCFPQRAPVRNDQIQVSLVQCSRSRTNLAVRLQISKTSDAGPQLDDNTIFAAIFHHLSSTSSGAIGPQTQEQDSSKARTLLQRPYSCRLAEILDFSEGPSS